MDDRISTEYQRTDKIWLTCSKHDLEHFWHTKNIDYIGARSFFYELGSDTKYIGAECPCPMRDLRVVTLEEHLSLLESGRLKY